MDALVTVSTEIAKALKIKEVMSMVFFFYIEKAYYTMWREGLLIKLSALGTKGRLYNWIMEILFDLVILVRVGSELSMGFEVDNVTPQGSVVSLIMFSLMIYYIFKEVEQGVGVALNVMMGIYGREVGREVCNEEDARSCGSCGRLVSDKRV